MGLGRGFESLERLFGAAPDGSVYPAAEAALGGIEDLSLRFGGIVPRNRACEGRIQVFFVKARYNGFLLTGEAQERNSDVSAPDKCTSAEKSITYGDKRDK